MNSLIRSFVDRCLAHSPRIGVVGDSMIDSYYQVSVNRISPEFPIPVMLAETDKPSKSVPGGAANVARQLLNLNCNNRLVTLTNPKLKDILKEYGILGCDYGFSTNTIIPEKRRFYDGDFPLCRLDIEKPKYGLYEDVLESYTNELVTRYRRNECNDDILILSDYGKGFFSDAHEWCGVGIPTIVDPKDGPLWRWTGCEVFKPNVNDAEKFSGGITDKKDQCKYIESKLRTVHIVVTDGGNGVYGLEDGEFFEIKNEHKVIPRSVIGAGDCFSAFLAVAIAHGFSVRDASEIAFLAGLQYVGNIHNEPVSLYDLLKSVDPIGAKFLNPTKNGGRLVFVNGCFDVLHRGHLEFLRFAKSKGDRLIVALNTDDSVKRLKGESRPIRTLKDRMAMVAGLDCVDFVTSFEENTPANLIEKIKPSVVACGEEYKTRSIQETGCFYRDIKMELFPRIEGISTTEEIKRIRS